MYRKFDEQVELDEGTIVYGEDESEYWLMIQVFSGLIIIEEFWNWKDEGFGWELLKRNIIFSSEILEAIS